MQSVIYDVQLLFPVLFLVGIGIVMVYSASSTLALKKFGTSYFFYYYKLTTSGQTNPTQPS